MDKRIPTLIFIYVIYLIVALTMVFLPTGQKMLTMILFGGGGIGLLLLFYFLWQQANAKE
jgi:hypothetical protein